MDQQGEAVEVPGRHVPQPPGRVTAGCRLQADNLRDVMIRAVQDGVFKRNGLILLMDAQTLDSSDRLTQVNLCLRSLWSSTTMALKP